MTLSKFKFPLGQVYMTRGIAELITANPAAAKEIQKCLIRHNSGDWGDICEEDKQTNEEALTEGFRLLSAYEVCGNKIWIITESDRRTTTILFPDEY